MVDYLVVAEVSDGVLPMESVGAVVVAVAAHEAEIDVLAAVVAVVAVAAETDARLG